MERQEGAAELGLREACRVGGGEGGNNTVRQDKQWQLQQSASRLCPSLVLGYRDLSQGLEAFFCNVSNIMLFLLFFLIQELTAKHRIHS